MIPAQGYEKKVIFASVSGTATAGASIDCSGADYATITINFAIELNTNGATPTVSVLENDTTVVSNFTTIVANRAEDLTAAHLVVYHVDMKYRKRYLRLTVTPGTTTNDVIVMGADMELSRKAISPGSTTEMVGSTNDAVVIVE